MAAPLCQRRVSAALVERTIWCVVTSAPSLFSGRPVVRQWCVGWFFMGLLGLGFGQEERVRGSKTIGSLVTPVDGLAS